MVVERDNGNFSGTLICHQTLFHSKKRKVFSALDHARAHVWPVGEHEMSAVGAVFDIAQALPCGQLTHHQLKKIVWDSWHLRVQGMFFAYLFANFKVQN